MLMMYDLLHLHFLFVLLHFPFRLCVILMRKSGNGFKFCQWCVKISLRYSEICLTFVEERWFEYLWVSQFNFTLYWRYNMVLAFWYQICMVYFLYIWINELGFRSIALNCFTKPYITFKNMFCSCMRLILYTCWIVIYPFSVYFRSLEIFW